ncbi:MAG: metallophosphoesterase [Okeania sp. SIO2F4]|uniref:metallophosphoesterase family protein n=1 Tax=Okeania sp. SIO2F4 TaxID=2607790 RepID=UPI001429951C|nr:metallophosphoesterase [Okeania sp. SIO2F4]NES02058.1 metallophosphoesterase [Okeania sp. SIO2F4]
MIPSPETFENPRDSYRNPWIFGILIIVVIFIFIIMYSLEPESEFLTDPFLQAPTENSVQVVWFTEFPGKGNFVVYGESLNRVVEANTIKLSRTREDQDSFVGKQIEKGLIYQQPMMRDIWRHEAKVVGLTPNNYVPYQIISEKENGENMKSKIFNLAAKPTPGTPLKILLTSDHQSKPMTSANLQKVTETFDKLDAIFFAGDLVNIPDRASEWFDDNRGNAFFPNLQGRAHYELEKNGKKTVYKGGELIQNMPLFPAIGNHEVMGIFSMKNYLNYQFSQPYPRQAAKNLYPQNPQNINPDTWLKNNSFNTDTYEEIFTLPQNSSDKKNYYAVTFGDIRLVVLYITNIWRVPRLDDNARGKYRERKKDFDNPAEWGYGQHIFEPIIKGSQQYNWLEKELASQEFQQAKYKVVMFHHPPHSLGENIVPAYTNPIQYIDRDENGKITTIRYEYPQQNDYIIRDVLPLLETSGVQLVFYGHSHLWNRFVSPSGMHFLETSNVGNSYGAYLGEKKRTVPQNYQEKYAEVGNPNSLEPIIPTIAPLLDENGEPQPYIASNDITAFSIFETETGTVSSYYFDTRKPNSEVVKFDEFKLRK